MGVIDRFATRQGCFDISDRPAAEGEELMS